MKKLFVIPLLALIMLSSCTAVVDNQADEIRLNRWSASLAGQRKVTLSFDMDIGRLYISEKEKSIAEIKGLALIEKTQIALYDSEDKVFYRFDYSLKENKLKLSTKDGSLTLKRN